MVISPIFGGSYPIARHCHEAFGNLGCTSEFADLTKYRQRYSEIRALGLDGFNEQQAFLNIIQEELWQHCETFKPNLVLALILAPLKEKLLTQMRQSGITTAYWFVDNDKRFPFWQRQSTWYDFYFMIQDGPVLADVRNAGGRSVHYLPNAVSSTLTTELSVSEDERKHFGSDVCFMGTPYKNRVAAFSQLAEFDLGLWGKGWDHYRTQFPNGIREGSRLISAEEESKIYASSKIVVNLHTDLGANLDGARDFVNPRTFVAAGCSAMQLVDKRSLMSHHFVPGEEIIEFDSIDDLKDRITYFLAHPSERQAIANKAHARVLNEHTYEQRMSQVIQWIATNR